MNPCDIKQKISHFLFDENVELYGYFKELYFGTDSKRAIGMFIAVNVYRSQAI